MDADRLDDPEACLARARKCFAQAQTAPREHREVLVSLGYAFLDFALDLGHRPGSCARAEHQGRAAA
jgi:hypothetical protein